MTLDREELKKLLKAKGVKSLDDFNAFMREVTKDVVETLLESELADHLGFEKYDQKTKATDNTRNSYTPKTIKSKFGEIDPDVPRDRKSDFKPLIVKKRQKDIAGLEETSKKWTFRHRDWAMIYSQLMIDLGERLGERAWMLKRGLHRISDTPIFGVIQ